MNLTSKQKQILSLLVAGNPDGTPLDLDELLDRLDYRTSKQSMQFSVRALAAKDLIQKEPTENRRGRSRRIFTVTPLGHHWFKGCCPPLIPMKIEDVIDMADLALMEDELGL